MFLLRFPIRFNSTTVQLIHHRILRHLQKLLCFNSTTVQLIRNEEKNIIKDYILFQFHNGTINTKHGKIPPARNNSFNSTTVQLIQ